MEFTINLRNITLEGFEKLIEETDLLPGRAVLKENLPGCIQKLADSGIKNMGDLISKTNTDEKLKALARKTGLTKDYLTILKREAGSYVSRSLAFHQFPGTSPTLISALQQKGIQNSKQLFEKAAEKNARAALAEAIKVSLDELTALTGMADLCRVNGIGPIFAVMLQKAGIRTTLQYAASQPAALLPILQKVQEEGGYTQVKLTVKDLEYCLRFAKMLGNGMEI